ncbi:MAG: hypothetical protein ACQSGP_27770 [Frankia sp.]
MVGVTGRLVVGFGDGVFVGTGGVVRRLVGRAVTATLGVGRVVTGLGGGRTPANGAGAPFRLPSAEPLALVGPAITVDFGPGAGGPVAPVPAGGTEALAPPTAVAVIVGAAERAASPPPVPRLVLPVSVR